MPSKSDREFGRIALREKWIAQKEIEECLRIQEDLETSGTPTSLDRILLAKSLLTPDQTRKIQEEQKRRIVFCKCGTRVNVFRYKPGKKLYCASCKSPIVVPSHSELEASLYSLMDDEAITEPSSELPLPLPPKVRKPLRANAGPEAVTPVTPPTMAAPPQDQPVMESPPDGQADGGAVPRGMRVIANRILGEKLGEGGMGAVYKVRHRHLDRVEAFKIVKTQYSMNPEYRLKFLREAKIAASLSHPNITRVIEIVDEQGILGYTMEYVEGETLASIIHREGAIEEKAVVSIMKQLASALQCIHEASIVHRDIKPGNVIIDRNGRAVLTDLGLAKNVSTAGRSGFTSEGATLGTPAYMAPEQIENAKYSDIRTDIYSLGALAYHALTGRPPFQGPSIYDFLSAVLNSEAVPPCEVNGDVSGKLSRIVMKMLAKDRAKRFGTPAELLRALEKLDAGKP